MDIHYQLQYQVHMQELENEELDDEEDRQQLAIYAASLLYVGAAEDRQARIEKRRSHRAYLRRANLVENPREGTPWQHLYESLDDRAFIVTMGFDVNAFHLILESGFEERWKSQPVPREDVRLEGAPRLHRRSLDAAGVLGLVLHYLSSTATEIVLQQIFALVPSTVSRYIDFGLKILLATLRELPSGAILWPAGEDFEEYSNLITARHDLLHGAFGSIDGLNLPCQTSDDLEIENATFNGWLHDHFVSSVLVFSPKGTIIAARVNCPGSWHDSRVAQPIYTKLRTRTPEGYYLVADTAFPRGTQQIEGRIKAPIKAGQSLPTSRTDLTEALHFDRQLLSYRQTAEWGMRGVQGAFGRLRVPLEIAHSQRRGDILETCVRLNNVRAETVGINQIRSVYVPLWQAGDQAEVWTGFETMLFGEQRHRDRVSRFHVTPMYE